MFESEHLAARREQRSRVAPCQQVHQGSFLERVDGPAHDRGNSITLEKVHEQIGGGGQIGDGPRPIGRDALSQPLAYCLAAYAEEARRLGLAQTPHLQRAREGTAAASMVRDATRAG